MDEWLALAYWTDAAEPAGLLTVALLAGASIVDASLAPSAVMDGWLALAVVTIAAEPAGCVTDEPSADGWLADASMVAVITDGWLAAEPVTVAITPGLAGRCPASRCLAGR
jgi:hypothetical protein